MSFGQNLRKYRKNKGMTQRELAEKIGVAVLAVKQWEGDKYEPTARNLKLLCQTLDVSAQILCGLAEPDFIVKDEDKEFLVELTESSPDIMKEMKKYFAYLKSNENEKE